MNLIFRKINAFRKLTYAIPKKCKKPYLFMVAYFFNTYFKLKIIKTVELKNGLKFNLTKNTDYLVVIEYCYNYYNIQNITAGNIVIDVGANAGDFSIFISPVIKKIYAFEPVPKTYKRFLNNIKLNKLKNIYPFQLGVHSKKGNFKINVPEQDGGAKISERGITIQTLTWDDLYILIKKPKIIDIIKIDCEGCEKSLLTHPTILQYTTEIRMELHTFKEPDIINSEKLIKLIQKYKFIPQNITYNKIYENIKQTKNFEINFKKI